MSKHTGHKFFNHLANIVVQRPRYFILVWDENNSSQVYSMCTLYLKRLLKRKCWSETIKNKNQVFHSGQTITKGPIQFNNERYPVFSFRNWLSAIFNHRPTRIPLRHQWHIAYFLARLDFIKYELRIARLLKSQHELFELMARREGLGPQDGWSVFACSRYDFQK